MNIFDVHRGRLALGVALPEQIPASLNAMALDETGTEMFVNFELGDNYCETFSGTVELGEFDPSLGKFRNSSDAAR